MTEKVIVGIDASFTCTGITIVYLNENNHTTNYYFNRVFHDQMRNKSGKPYTPRPIRNVEDFNYTMPVNLPVENLIFDMEDENNVEQCDTTLRGMMASQRVFQVVKQHLDKVKPKEIYICVENYIMPSFNSKKGNSLKNVSGLIMMQGHIRKFFVAYAMQVNCALKLLTPTPKTVKLSFAGNGGADKDMMIHAFIHDYDGKTLIPDVHNVSVDAIEDVVDSFALTWYCYGKMLKYLNL